MHYCTPNETDFGSVWWDNGFLPCSLETVGPSSLCVLAILFLILQIQRYRKGGRAYDRDFKPRNIWFNLQLFLLGLMPMMILFRFAVQATVLQERRVAGYMIAYCVTYFVALSLAIIPVVVERNYGLRKRLRHRHGSMVLVFWASVILFELMSFANWQSPFCWWKLETYDDKVELGLYIFRLATTVAIFIFGFLAPGRLSAEDLQKWKRGELEKATSTVTSPLLKDGVTFKKHEESTFTNLRKKLSIIVPYLWPKNQPRLHLCILLIFAILVAGRVTNLLTPMYYKYIVDSLTEGTRFPYDLILTYVLIRCLQGSDGGIMGSIRQVLWVQIEQYTVREIDVSLFAHIHTLSLRWHLSRKTGELIRVLGRSTGGFTTLLNFVLFDILPTLTDIAIAIVFFVTAFNAWFGLIVCVTMFLYLVGTAYITEWKTKYRREGNLLDNAIRQKATDSLLNYETVKYYCTEKYETNRLREAILSSQKMEWLGALAMCGLNIYQILVLNCGLLLAALLCAWMVVEHKTLKVGDYVLLGTYIVQLYGPLGMLGAYYRMIQTIFVDMENMFDLLDEKPEIVDSPAAEALTEPNGQLEFRDVHFAYEPARPILKGISFKVPAGHTVALVGPTGSGKSTVIRLLFRFYDIQSGVILFDGKDIRTIQQTSLREAIGVVPQDTVLFNESIKYNIRYGRIAAPDGDVEDAAKAAEIHDKILSFPQQYDTVVGERGLKLSGGEKQRVAIARTILKSPVVVLLDEATSALDTQTERQIQNSLSYLYENRTTVIVAHRLSTIIHANEILVLREGEIAERGSHTDLLAQKGLYFSMWEEQLRAPPKFDKLLDLPKHRAIESLRNSRANSGSGNSALGLKMDQLTGSLA